MILLNALKKAIDGASSKGVRARSKAGAIRSMPYYWTRDLEGWMPEGFEFPFEAET